MYIYIYTHTLSLSAEHRVGTLLTSEVALLGGPYQPHGARLLG